MPRSRSSRSIPSVVLTVLVGLAFLASLPATLPACTCAPPGPPRQELERADAVFTGKVESIEPAPSSGDNPRWPSRLEVTLRLLGVWKGLPEGDRVTLYTASQSAACGFGFEEGKKYLVYAYDADGELTATLCSRTALLKRAQDDLTALGTPVRQAD
jgi:hypothetical protein